jgi:hypothetical protein
MAAGLPGESSISIAGLRSAKEIFNGNVAMLTPYLSKHHIQKKISLIILILISMLLCACFPALNTQCRHKAIFCASVMRESCPVRIVTGLNPQGIRHAQAQAQVNKKWEWLAMRGDEVRPLHNSKFCLRFYFLQFLKFGNLIEIKQPRNSRH